MSRTQKTDESLRTMTRLAFRALSVVGLVVITGLLLQHCALMLDPHYRPPGDESSERERDRIFTQNIHEAFRKEQVTVKEIFPGEWDYVCTASDYNGAETIRGGLSLSKDARLHVTPHDIYYDENQGGLMFVKKIAENDFSVDAYIFIRAFADGTRLEGGGMCRDKIALISK